MAKVTMRGAEKAAEGSEPAKAPAGPAGSLVRVDARGRRLVIKRPTALQRLRLYEAVGASASNPIYFGHVALAASVVQIDEDVVVFPRTKREIEALVELLGDEGLQASSEAVAELVGVELDPLTGEVRQRTDTVALAKN